MPALPEGERRGLGIGGPAHHDDRRLHGRRRPRRELGLAGLGAPAREEPGEGAAFVPSGGAALPACDRGALDVPDATPTSRTGARPNWPISTAAAPGGPANVRSGPSVLGAGRRWHGRRA